MYYKQKNFTEMHSAPSKHKIAKKYKVPENDVVIFSDDFVGDMYADREQDKVNAK